MFGKSKIQLLGLFFLCAALAALAACAKEPRQPVGIYDTAYHHYDAGLQAIDKMDYMKADKEFDLALELDPEYGPAMAGKGLVIALQGGNLDEALDKIDDGRDEAKNDTEELECIKAEIRALTAGGKFGYIGPEELAEESEDAFEDGVDLDEKEKDAGLYYYQGIAYMTALEFPKAAEMFAKVKTIGTKHVEDAENKWEMMNKASRAAPGSMIGKKIVLADQVSRADMAGLLVEELKVERFYDRTEKPEEITFVSPESRSDMVEKDPTRVAVDIADHPLEGDIVTVVELGVQGLEVGPDRRFEPDKPLTKAEIAMIFQDIIIRAMNDDSLATKYIGQQSPFPDVSPNSPFFNAIMVSTTRGLMEAGKRYGKFEPLEPVPGVDALLYVKNLQENLNPFAK